MLDKRRLLFNWCTLNPKSYPYLLSFLNSNPSLLSQVSTNSASFWESDPNLLLCNPLIFPYFYLSPRNPNSLSHWLLESDVADTCTANHLIQDTTPFLCRKQTPPHYIIHNICFKHSLSCSLQVSSSI